MLSGDLVRVKTDQLPVGSRLSHPVNDSENRLLLAAGVTLTPRLKDRLISRGIDDVLLHPDDAAVLFGDASALFGDATALFGKAEQSSRTAKKSTAAAKILAKESQVSKQQAALRETAALLKTQAAALAAAVPPKVQNTGPPLKQRQSQHGTDPYNMGQRKRLSQHFAVTTQLLSDLASSALKGRVEDDHILSHVTEDYVEELTDDTDNVLATSRELAPNPQLTERGIRLSLLGMATAIEMEWDEHHVREVGLCGLIHDLGMVRLQPTLQDQKDELSAQAFQQLVDHPLHTLDLISSMKNISLPVRLAATQVHENPDGTGYPRRLKSNDIHPYASLLHAADAFISLTAKMHGRPAYLSYDVMVYLLNQVKAGRMDESAMRALLQAVTLFPIGSHVRLSDGTEAQVLRRNQTNYTAPIVQRVGADRKVRFDSKNASILDLAATKMTVMSPLIPPDSQEGRIDDSHMAEVLWHGIAK